MATRYAALILLPVLAFGGTKAPAFEDFPAPMDWRGPVAPIKLTTSSERMFRTRLSEAMKQPPNFAGHYRVTYWGCGSICTASAIVDLQTGNVYPPPLGGNGNGWDRWISCTASFEGAGDDFRVDSRLFITRCGPTFDKHGKNQPDVFYLLWEGSAFRELLHLKPETAK
jgi:hypothetical protein